MPDPTPASAANVIGKAYHAQESAEAPVTRWQQQQQYQQQVRIVYEALTESCAAGAWETGEALRHTQQRIKAERAVAVAYANGLAGATLPSLAFCGLSGACVAAPHRHLASRLEEEAVAPLVVNLKRTEGMLKSTAELAARLAKDHKLHVAAQARARVELQQRYVDVEGLSAEYQKLVSSSTPAGRGSPHDGDEGLRSSGSARVSGRAGSEKLARLSQRLAVANAKVAEAEAAYRRERASEHLRTWKYFTVELPAVCLTLQAVEACRAEALATATMRSLHALGELSGAHTRAVEENTLRIAQQRNRERAAGEVKL